jgi:large subunit ribosomal protein L25
MEGGVITHSITELEISCLPADLPEYIAIDMTDLKMDEILHISDIKLPEGVESVALSHGDDHDLPVAAIHMPRAALEEEKPVEAEDDAADTEAEDKAEGDTEGEDED